MYDLMSGSGILVQHKMKKSELSVGEVCTP